MKPVDLILLRDQLLAAIREDAGSGDVTSRSTIDSEWTAVARYVTKQDLIVSGLPVVEELARLCDAGLRFRSLSADGDAVPANTVLAEVQGNAHSILTLERTSLNFLQRLSGIATTTAEYVARVSGTVARIVDTRKTVPGLRLLDKYAVRCGGGLNHRFGLFDGVLIKNNHLVFHPGVAEAVQAARQRLGHLARIEVEVTNPRELDEAIAGGADVILLDNHTPRETRTAVLSVAGRVPLESSGGISLENVRDYADAGVDYVSVGALTHSVTGADIHLQVRPTRTGH